MEDIIIVSGSPSRTSRSERILYYLGELIEERDLSIRHISVKDISAEDLLYGNFQSPEIIDVSKALERAKGVVIGSPVYKASYSGVLKALIDLLPQDVLQDTPVLPVMTGGSPSHLLALEYGLKPLLSTLKAINLKGLYYVDEQLSKTELNPILDSELLIRTEKQLDYFIGWIKEKASVF